MFQGKWIYMKRLTFRFILLGLIIFLVGCSEAEFSLSPDSRLPKWFEIPEGQKREDFTVILSYYVWPSGREATLRLKRKGDWLSKDKIVVKLIGLEPIKLKNSSDGYYPSYEIITGNDITDIIEHRQMKPIFYLTDDPTVWKELVKTIEK